MGMDGQPLGLSSDLFPVQMISVIPSEIMVYVMVGAQGFLGYGLLLFWAVPAELYGGKGTA